jgi:hypothetical protein
MRRVIFGLPNGLERVRPMWALTVGYIRWEVNRYFTPAVDKFDCSPKFRRLLFLYGYFTVQ